MVKLLKMVRAYLSNIFFRKSYLYLYLCLLREDISHKRRRIFDDTADLINHQQTSRYLQRLRHQQIQNLSQQGIGHDLLDECIDPCTPYLFFWYLLVLTAIFYYFFEATIAFAYGQTAWQSLMSNKVIVGLDWLLIVVLCIDTLLQLELGYIRMGVVVTNRFKVIDRYLHYYIFFDIGVIVVLILAVGTGHYTLNYFKLIIVVKVFRVFEINWLVLRTLVTRRLMKVFYVIARQLASTILFAHCIGIIFYAIDNSQINTPACQGKKYQLCWLHNSTAYEPISSLPWQWQYFYSLYWGINIVCNIGYGDIAPINPKETVFACFCFVLCLLFAGYIIKQIVGVLGAYIEAKENYREELMSYTRYMELLRLDINAQQQIKDFLYERYMKHQYAFDGKQLIQRLPQQLKIAYYKSAYKQFFNGLVNFYGKEKKLSGLLYSIKEQIYASGELICRQGEFVDSLNYLHSGSINLYTYYGQSQRKITQINCPSSFYLAYEFFLAKTSLYSIVTSQKSVCYFIPGQALSLHYQSDEEQKQSFHLVIHQLINQRCFAKIFYNCYFCHANHHWYQCSYRFFCPSLTKVKCKRQSNHRLAKNTHKTLKDRSRLNKLNEVRQRNSDYHLRMIQRRLSKLIKRAKQRVQFDVDKMREWSIYLQHDNFTKIQAQWNNKANNQR